MLNIERKILRKVEHTLITRRLVQAGDTVVVGVSGGPDSVALLHILLDLAPKFSFQVAIAHLNHGLRRDESARDEAFVVSLAEQLDLRVHVERQDVRRYQKKFRLSLEEAWDLESEDRDRLGVEVLPEHDADERAREAAEGGKPGPELDERERVLQDLVWVVEDLVEHVATDEAGNEHPRDEGVELVEVEAAAARSAGGERCPDDDAGDDEQAEGMER